MNLLRKVKIFSLAVMILAAGNFNTAFAVVSPPSDGGNSFLHAIGWQTFDNAGADNNSGIADNTPDSNSTFDATPVGSHAAVSGGGQYLTGSIGPGASILEWDGFGQSTDDSFLQGDTFGSKTIGSAPFGIDLFDVTLADGSAGDRLNLQGQSGSSWKFSAQNSANQLLGDISIKNESDYYFRLERIHFDARSANANGPQRLELLYLASGDSNLVRADNGNEVLDLRVFSNITFPSSEPNTAVHNVSQSLAAQLFPNTAVRLAPGDSASFRFRWSNYTNAFAQSQIDNIAFSGTFQDQNSAFASIDPAAVSASFDPADLNMDGFVDGLDLGVLLGNWNQTTTPDMGELNGTPPVDGLDLGILLGAWNPPPVSAANAIPEPKSLVTLIAGVLMLCLTKARKHQ